MTVDELIAAVIAEKSGDKEFRLGFVDGCGWTAEVGNSCPYVLLGESDGDYSARGQTPRDAVANLLATVRLAQSVENSERAGL